MTITITSTSKIVHANGIACRVWEGQTSSGVRISALIPRIAVAEGQNVAEFEADLEEHAPPSAKVQAWPLRLVL